MSTRQPIYQDIVAPNTHPRHRKPIIQRLQEQLKGKLLVYTANPWHPLAQIFTQDVPGFEDLLLSTGGGDVGYLMINSPGGDANAAEKLLTMCRQRFKKEFNVIVPDYAKSAATMLALGSDKILMGYLAELGPVDPQLRTGPFLGTSIPARSFIDGLEMIRTNVKQKGDPVQLYYPMLSQIRPEIVAQSQSAIDFSKAFVEKWLKKHMLKDKPEQASQVANWLSEGKKYKSHGKVIDYNEAHDVLQLNVEKIDPDSKLWMDIWELYCRSITFLQSRGSRAAKLFESESVSLILNIEVIHGPPKTQSPRPSIRPIRPLKRPPQEPTKTKQLKKTEPKKS